VHERLSVPSNPKMIFHQAIAAAMGTNSSTTATDSPPTATNAPTIKTNLLATMANAPATTTNSPTGKPDPSHKTNLAPKSF